MYTSKDDVRGLVTTALREANLPDPASLVGSLEEGLQELPLHQYTEELARRADVFLTELGKRLMSPSDRNDSGDDDDEGVPPETPVEETVQSLLAALYPAGK